MGDQGPQEALSGPRSYPFVWSCGAILSPRPHAVYADVSSGGQERARIARPQGLVLDGQEDGGTMAANVARRGQCVISIYSSWHSAWYRRGWWRMPSSTPTRSGSISRSTS